MGQFGKERAWFEVTVYLDKEDKESDLRKEQEKRENKDRKGVTRNDEEIKESETKKWNSANRGVLERQERK